jgi:dolichol-phosphate mannosyltransferase
MLIFHNPNDLENYTMPVILGMLISLVRDMLQELMVIKPCADVVFCISICSNYYGMKIHDATAGFICYREVLAEIDLNKIKFVGYAFQIEMKYRTFCKSSIL